jgi:hypothetical protein
MAGASVAAGASVIAGASVATGAGEPQAANAKDAITRRLITLKSKLFFIYSSP